MNTRMIPGVAPERLLEALIAWARRRGEPTDRLFCHKTESGGAVALAGRFAAKVFPLRFTSAERRALVALELSLSRRLPQGQRIAHGRGWLSGATLTMRPKGEDDEPVLIMYRLPPNHELAPRLERGDTHAERLARSLGNVLAHFHSRSPPRRADARQGGEESQELQGWLDRIDGAIETLKLGPSQARAVRSAADLAAALRSSVVPMLEERALAGWRRDGHGDLHSDNLSLLRGWPTLRDPLPFPEYRIADVCNDLGRLVLEASRLGGTGCARAITEGYAKRFAPQPKELIQYFSAKAVLFETVSMGKRVVRGQALPPRSTRFFDSIAGLDLKGVR
jgi:aminoglycoside phosphotransferase family enzyme